MHKRKRAAERMLPSSSAAKRNGSRFHCYPWSDWNFRALPATMRTVLLSATPLLVAATAAIGQAPDARALAAGCASCHRRDGTTIPSLQGRSRDELLAKLHGFRDGSQAGTVMPQLARGYTEAQLEAIAAWYAEQRTSAR